MKLKTLSTVAIVCFFAIGCKSKVAMDYNDMIVKKQKSLAESIDQNEPKLKNYFATYEYDSIASVSGRMEAKIDSILRDIQNKPAPKVKEGENFKKVALNYFDYMKTLYTSYKNYGLETTPEGRIVGREVIARVTNVEDKMIADMQEAQRIFAKDNGFKIKPAKQKQNGSFTANPPNQ
jgi:hypothetical protein